MSKELMIKVLRYKAEHIKTKIRPEFFAEVADMLEQQPCEDCCNGDQEEKAKLCQKSYLAGMEHRQEPCEDAISRADAVRVASGYCHPANIAKELAKLPPVTPKPKVGHWVEYTRVLTPEPINRWEQAWYCSECGYGNQECEDGSAWLEWKYCPNCGKRMIGPQESEG